MRRFDVVVLGAGAAGMMCAIEAGRRGRKVLIIDHAKSPGEKIRISGGGRCNFTNTRTAPGNFLSQNRHFCKSALSRYTQHDFVALIEQAGIAYHEKTLGQLFCDGSSRQVIDMLTGHMRDAGVELAVATQLEAVERQGNGFDVRLSGGSVQTRALVVASGGRSIPKMGATGLGYRIAEQFGLALTDIRPALVPLTFDEQLRERLKPLSGVSVDAVVSCNGTAFKEAMLFTHRGISGPSILQISSYWREGDEITLSLLPGEDLFALLRNEKAENGRQSAHTALSKHLPRRLAQIVCEGVGTSGKMAEMPDRQLLQIAGAVQQWCVKPTGSEGYRTAEVTLGGVDTGGLDSKTMQAKAVPGLYFIGEAVDVTGWLGGYNFQWAWSSGWVAGQVA